MAVLLPGCRPHVSPEQQYAGLLAQSRNGDFSAAAAAAGEAAARAPQEWRLRFLLLQAEALLDGGKPKDAEAILAIPDSAATAEFQIRARVLNARRLMVRSSFEEAGLLLDQASRLAASAGRTELIPEILNQQGQWYGRQRKSAEAEDLFIRSRALAAQVNDLHRQAGATNNLGLLRVFRSHCDEAIPFFEQALQLSRKENAAYAIASNLNNLAMCYSQLGDFDRAISYSQEALHLVRPSPLLARINGETGTLYLNQQNPAKAVPYYREALKIARDSGELADAARWAGNLTSALASASEWTEAEKAIAEARQLKPEPRSLAFLDLAEADVALGQRKLDQARSLYAKVIAAHPENQNALWPAYAGIGNTWLAAGQQEKGDRAFQEAIRIIEQSQSSLTGAGHKMTFLARLIQFHQDYVEFLMNRGETARALAVADNSRARLLVERFAKPLAKPTNRGGTAYQAVARASGRVWLSYWLAPKRGYLWVVTPKETRVLTLPGLAAITPLVERYRGFVETSLRDPIQTESEAGRKLYETLIAPALPLLPKDAAVMIVPDGPLHQLSFESLPVYGQGKPHYLLEDYELAITPSFGLFHAPSGRRESARGALLLGDPVSPAAEYPRLQFAARELDGVASHLAPNKITRITGAEAKPERWASARPADYSIIHIAAHAEANSANPLDSALILSPGNGYRLRAADLLDTPLHADLVTLSACRSSGAKVYAGEGLVGLSWAFLHAGANAVIAGLWDVADESTAILMDHLYEGIAAGKTPPQALRGARIAMLRTPYNKPYYWGPFECYLR